MNRRVSELKESDILSYFVNGKDTLSQLHDIVPNRLMSDVQFKPDVG